MLKEQWWWEFLAYNINIENHPDSEQVFSTYKWITGIQDKIRKSDPDNIDFLLKEDPGDEPAPALIDRQAGYNLPKKQHSHLLNFDKEKKKEIHHEDSMKASLSRQKLTHMKQGKTKFIPIEIAPEETMQLHEIGLAMKQRKIEESK